MEGVTPNTNEEHETDNLKRVFAELNKETDRGAILVAVAMLDETVGELLQKHFIDLKLNSKRGNLVANMMRTDGQLGSFANRLKLSAALGLISERKFRMAERLREIRNEFAHKVEGNFQNDKIVRMLETLMPIGGTKIHPENFRHRARFIGNAAMLEISWRTRIKQIRQASYHLEFVGYL